MHREVLQPQPIRQRQLCTRGITCGTESSDSYGVVQQQTSKVPRAAAESRGALCNSRVQRCLVQQRRVEVRGAAAESRGRDLVRLDMRGLTGRSERSQSS